MKLVCLVKQVPHPTAIEFDEETKTLRREGVPLELNPFDRFALAHAVGLRRLHGGEVVAMTMGPPQAEEALREALSLGADRCVHLSDRVFAVADTLGTSRTLALAVAREGADLVLCGRKTIDSETWQVPPEVAAFLGWPHLTSAVELALDGERLRARRESDRGSETYELPLPAVVSLASPPTDGATPDGTNGAIDLWSAADLVDDLRPDDKRFGQPGSPTRVLAVRDARPERAGIVVSSPEEAAGHVIERLGALPRTPAGWDKPPHAAEQPAAARDCWSLVELVDGRPTRTSLELLARGRTLAGKLGGSNVAVLLGNGLEEPARETARHGAERVFAVDDERLADYHPELWTAALRALVEEHRPHVLLIPASADGRDLGPRLAGELRLGMTGDCVNVDIAKAGRLLQTKPAFGGNIVSVIMGATTPQLATVRARMFEPLKPRDGAGAEIRVVRPHDLPQPRVAVVDRTPGRPAFDLDAADVVVVLGGEVREAAEVSAIEAGATAYAALGGTRETCEAGLVPRNRQIGLFGRPVAPRLLVAVGVHGDFDHLSGFVKAGVLVALAAQADAPILEAADVGLVGDWRRNLLPLHELVAPHV